MGSENRWGFYHGDKGNPWTYQITHHITWTNWHLAALTNKTCQMMVNEQTVSSAPLQWTRMSIPYSSHGPCTCKEKRKLARDSLSIDYRLLHLKVKVKVKVRKGSLPPKTPHFCTCVAFVVKGKENKTTKIYKTKKKSITKRLLISSTSIHSINRHLISHHEDLKKKKSTIS